jgi:hypothetical protein
MSVLSADFCWRIDLWLWTSPNALGNNSVEAQVAEW